MGGPPRLRRRKPDKGDSVTGGSNFNTMEKRKPVIATAGEYDGRTVVLRDGERCTVHGLSAADATLVVREGMDLEGGVDACTDCLIRIRTYLTQ